MSVSRLTPGVIGDIAGVDVTGCPRETRYPLDAFGRPNPQAAALALQSLLSSDLPKEQRLCEVRRAASVVVESATRRGAALLFPYRFDYRHGRTDVLRAPWFSGLAQTTIMTTLRTVAALTRKATYDRAARGAFESLFLARSQGGFVERVAGGRWIQEYPTSIPSYVLNGHLFAVLSVRSYAAVSGERRGNDLFRDGVRAAEALLPLYDVPEPGAHVSAYDLLRSRDGDPLRVVGTRVRRAHIEDAKGGTLLDVSPHALMSYGGVSLRYPVSVRAIPRLYVRVSSDGPGIIQARSPQGWTTIGHLHGNDTVEVPQRFQGRTINMRYHAIHVQVLRRLARASGSHVMLHWAGVWGAGE